MLRTLLVWILDWALQKVAAHFKKKQAQEEQDERIENETKKEADSLKESKTDDDDEKSAKDILSRS